MRRLIDTLRLRLRSLFRSRATEQDLARELQAHLDEEIASHVAAGLSPENARQTALRSFGSVPLVADECRDTRRVNPLVHLARDLRYAVRTLGRQPWLLMGAATSIGLGVGANLTIVALANHLVFSVPSADRANELVNIRMNNGSHVSYRAWEELERSRALAGLAGYQFEQSVNWRNGDQSTTIVPLLVTANFFDVLRPPLALGRGFSTEEADATRQPRVVVVSHGFWKAHLAADPDVVGRALVLNGETYRITGVLAPHTRGIAGYGLAPEVYLPLSLELVPSLLQPRTAGAQLFGRLRPNQSVSAGRAALSVIVSNMRGAEASPEFTSITEFQSVGGLSQVREMRAVGAFFLVLLAVSGIVLAIACANVAGLLLARGLSRRREIALRLALGASRGRLVQQLLTESLVVSALGALIGGGITASLFVLLSRVSLPLPLPFEVWFAIDWRLTTIAAVLVVVATCLAGLAPALQATRVALTPSMKVGESPRRAGRLTLRTMLVSGQVALSLLLLVVALTFARNLVSAGRLDPGFDVDRVLVAQIAFVEGRQGSPTRRAVEDITATVRALPGVEAAAFSDGVPLTIFSGSANGTLVRIDGGEAVRVDFDNMEVGPSYFATMGIRLVRGRDFTERDRDPTSAVVIINEEFARRYFEGAEPLGRTIADPEGGRPPREVIGVVTNGKYRSLAEATDAATYEPLLATPRSGRLVHLLVRSHAAPDALIPSVRQAVLAADGSAAVTVTPLSSALAFALLPSQLGSAILGALGGLGTLLAMVGLFGVVSFTVSRRTPEIAIRVALGASRRAVIRLVVMDAARIILAGAAVGVLLSWFLAVPLSVFLVPGVSPVDPVVLLASATLLVATSLAAVWAPVRRALGIAPTTALRLE